MRLRLETDYGIRCVLFLSQHQEYVQAGRIAAATNVPENVVPRVLSRLKKAGIVSARSGVMGGHKLCRKVDEISLFDIVDCMEDCLALSRSEDISSAETEVEKALHAVEDCFNQIQQQMEQFMRSIKINQLVEASAC